VIFGEKTRKTSATAIISRLLASARRKRQTTDRIFDLLDEAERYDAMASRIAGQAERLAHKRAAADRKREADRQRQTDEIAELGWVKFIALPVREMVEREESSLSDATDLLVEDPHDRLFRSCMGRYRQRKVGSLSSVRDRDSIEASNEVFKNISPY
jgi:hypothetical protein